jgi:Mrp family chromosome partitioning ATPase
MPDRVLKPEILKGGISSISAEGLRPALERADLFLPVATEISPVSAESRVVVFNEPRSAGADRFRLVRARLRNIQAAKKLKSVLITSPLPEDGKSTISLNLATVLSEGGKAPVLLLEADVYRPGLVKTLGLKPWPGLTECYKRGTDPMLAMRRIDPLGFYLLPGGQPIDDSNCLLLQSSFTSQLFKGLASSSFSWILVDAPPTTPVADILALKALADATLLVARAGKTPREAIEESARNLGRDHIVGLILNGMDGLDRVYSKYYGYGSSETREGPTQAKLIEGLGIQTQAR